MLRTIEANFLPVVAAIRCFIHAIADGYRITHIAFAGTGVNYFIIFWLNSNRPNALAVFVKNGTKGNSSVLAFPNAAACRTNIQGQLIAYINTFNSGDAAAHGRRAKCPCSKGLKIRRVDGCLGKCIACNKATHPKDGAELFHTIGLVNFL